MSKDNLIYIHCPEIIESPLHQNENQIIDGILIDICDILKYSFSILEDRTINYYGRKIDLDYKIERNNETIETFLSYNFIFRDRTINCKCNITKVLDDMKNEKAFLNDYTDLIKFIVKDIGEKSLRSIRSNLIILKFADLKRHYNK